MPLAVLFDLDNTLVDRDLAWTRFLTLRGLDGAPLADALEIDASGYTDRHTVAAWLAHRHPERWPSCAAALEDALTTVPALTSAVPGAHALLERLGREARLGVVSNGGPGQHVKARHAGIDTLVETIVVSSDVGEAKPHPRPFRRALSALGAAPAETWFVGDHPEHDVVGAAALGMQTVWISRGRAWPSALPPPDREVAALVDLGGTLC